MRKLYFLFIIQLFFMSGFTCFADYVVSDKANLTSVVVNSIIKPKSIEDIQRIVRSTKKTISVAGGRYSQGGQIAYPDGIVIDMSSLNKIIAIDARNKKITVQTGAQWKDVQEVIDKLNLSVRVMQSYNDFTIGGALSVNVHARDISEGPIIDTVDSIKLVLADGSLVTASKKENHDLFRAAIGGYGLIGIIVEATLSLTENIKLERVVEKVPARNIRDFFETNIKKNDRIIFHNIDLFPNEFNKAQSVAWCKTDQALTNKKRLQKTYWWNKIPEFFIRLFPSLKNTRPKLAKAESKVAKINFIPNEVVWRNYEMSYSVDQLSLSSKFISKVTLQEYFVPEAKLQKFIRILRDIIQKHNAHILNVSIRHVRADKTSLMSYAQQDSYAFVLYIDVHSRIKKLHHNIENWSQELINAVVSLGGTYYLPYLLSGTKEQFYKAYPNFIQLLQLKKQYDPNNKFKNMLYKKYV